MVVVVPSYNNIRYYKGNIDSILDQQYSNFRIIYIDDCSNDGMSDLIEKYLQEKKVDFRTIEFKAESWESIEDTTKRFCNAVNSGENFFIYVRNQNRAGALANIYRSVLSSDDSDVIVLVDGDDKLSDNEVLKRVNLAYNQKKAVWMTHGTLIENPTGSKSWCEPIPDEIIKKNAFREFKCPSHLRTFYSWLFKKIDLQDLMYQGNFFQMTWDMAIMYPMSEMAGERHEFLKEINYQYNVENNINDNKVNPQLQNDLDRLIRNMPRYEPLQESDIPSYARRKC